MKDVELIRLLSSKQPEGIERLKEQYGSLIRYIIEPILSDERDREECYADVIYRIWNYVDRYDKNKANFTTWITAITRNDALNKARSNKKTDEWQEVPEEIASERKTPEEEMLYREMLTEVGKLINRLSMRDTSLLYRKYYYMQSTEQIAKELGVTVRAVEGRLYRIKQKLRKEIIREQKEQIKQIKQQQLQRKIYEKTSLERKEGNK